VPEFILRAYEGRENGLMIIGSAEALGRLGVQLQSAANAEVSALLPDWPPAVARPSVSGPYLNVTDFELSFHVLRAEQLPKSLSLLRRGPPLALLLTIAALSLIGLVSIVRLLL
jgi:hypothetical protein